MTGLSREEILARYRHLRAISVRHHNGALEFLSKSALMGHARHLGLTEGKVLVAESMEELTLAFDLAVYTAKPGHSRAIDRYASAGISPYFRRFRAVSATAPESCRGSRSVRARGGTRASGRAS